MPLGHVIAFGNLLEELERKNRGVAARGSAADGVFNHATGLGIVEAVLGLYHDAIHVKKNELLLLISDTFGGVSDEAFRYLRHLAATASAEGATDKTKYDTRRPWHVSFFEHHARRLSAAAALGHHVRRDAPGAHQAPGQAPAPPRQGLARERAP